MVVSNQIKTGVMEYFEKNKIDAEIIGNVVRNANITAFYDNNKIILK